MGKPAQGDNKGRGRNNSRNEMTLSLFLRPFYLFLGRQRERLLKLPIVGDAEGGEKLREGR